MQRTELHLRKRIESMARSSAPFTPPPPERDTPHLPERIDSMAHSRATPPRPSPARDSAVAEAAETLGRLDGSSRMRTYARVRADLDLEIQRQSLSRADAVELVDTLRSECRQADEGEDASHRLYALRYAEIDADTKKADKQKKDIPLRECVGYYTCSTGKDAPLLGERTFTPPTPERDNPPHLPERMACSSAAFSPPERDTPHLCERIESMARSRAESRSLSEQIY